MIMKLKLNKSYYITTYQKAKNLLLKKSDSFVLVDVGEHCGPREFWDSLFRVYLFCNWFELEGGAR